MAATRDLEPKHLPEKSWLISLRSAETSAELSLFSLRVLIDKVAYLVHHDGDNSDTICNSAHDEHLRRS